MYTIYKHTSPSGKVYIGQTRRNPKYRWNFQGSGYIKSSHFYNAIQKYGWDNIEHDIIQTTDTKEKADILEKMWISFYRKRTGVYNLTDGGEACPTDSLEVRAKISKVKKGRKVAEDVRQKISETLRRKIASSERAIVFGREPWNKGFKGYGSDRVRTEESKRKCSESLKKAYAEGHRKRESPFKGKHHTQESREKMSNVYHPSGSDSNHHVRYKDITTNITYDTLKQLQEKLSLSNFMFYKLKSLGRFIKS